MRNGGLRPWTKSVLWVLILGQTGEVLGMASPERMDPGYHASHYLQPCKTGMDCGARQFCMYSQCTCPFMLGLTGAPHCTTMSKGAWVLLCWSIFTAVVELSIAYFHFINLRAHWKQSRSQPSPSSPSSAAPLGSVTRIRSPAVAPTPNPPSPRAAADPPAPSVPLLEWLLTFKSLFSLSSLVFCLAPISLTITLSLILLDPFSDVEVLYASAGSVQTVVAIVSFNGMALAYLFMGEIWLDAASRFRLRIFIGTRLSKLLLQLPVLVLIVLTVLYVLSSSSPSAQMLVAMLGLGVCALIASGFLTVGASIIIPVIRERARQAEEAGMAGGTAAVSVPGEQGSREPARRSIMRFLRRKRGAPFRPVLPRISEEVSSVIESSASHGYLSSSLRLPRGSSHNVLSRSGRHRVGPEEEEGGKEEHQSGVMARGTIVWVQRKEGAEKRQDEDEEEQDLVEAGERKQAGSEPATQRLPGTKGFNGLAWHVASTAMQVGGASVLSVGAYVVGFFLLTHARSRDFDPTIGALGTLCVYAAFPLLHLYGNLVCLVVISREARDAVAPLRARVAALLWSLLWDVLCCGLSEDGEEDDVSGLVSPAVKEAMDAEV